MSLKIAHISDLSGMYFNVPDYQRGYRWEKKQVIQLLDDLFEFHNTSNKAPGQFYCLQPLVVVENKSILNCVAGMPTFDVIDGQQRLTTLYLILSYLGLSCYKLRFERINNPKSNKYTDGELLYSNLTCLTSYQIESNPDYFYLKQAIDTIDGWFKNKSAVKPRIKRNIEDALLAPTYTTPTFPIYDINYVDININLNDVRFIWYDAAVAGSSSYKDSIDIFKRLNAGKTSLTPAELVKALLFQCDIYPSSDKPEMKQVAFRRSTEWDAIEKKLQDKYLWSMLGSPQSQRRTASHIDVILSFVANEIATKYSISRDTKDKYYEYLVINDYLFQVNNVVTIKNRIDEVWCMLQDVYAMFCAWYDDVEYYHLIGLYLILLNNSDYYAIVQGLKTEFQKGRDSFINWLKKEIGEKIKLKGDLTLDNIRYGDNSKEIEKILLVYNVHLCMTDRQYNQRFPFFFYKNATPSLEHIHPQNLNDEDIDFPIICKWYNDKKSCLVEWDKQDPSRKKTDVKFKDAFYAIPNLDSILSLTEEVAKETNQMEVFKRNKQTYEAKKSTYLPELRKMDKFFNELADISDAELHSIYNMALVDLTTNIKLCNGLLCQKRAILQELSDKFNKTNGKEGAITFPGTWKAFNKGFYSNGIGALVPAKDSNIYFWTKTDRDNYKKELTKIYDEYVK